MMIPQKNTTIIHSTHSLTHSFTHHRCYCCCCSSLFPSFSLSVSGATRLRSLSSFARSCLQNCFACLLILLPKGFATSQDQHLSISLLKNSINQSGKFQSVDWSIHQIHYHQGSSTTTTTTTPSKSMSFSFFFFYYCLLLDLFIVPRSAHTKQTTHPPLMLSPAFGWDAHQMLIW